MGVGWTWFKKWTSAGLFWMRWWNFRFSKGKGIITLIINQQMHLHKISHYTYNTENSQEIAEELKIHLSLPSGYALLRVKVKCSRYRPGVAQRVGRGIALPFHYRGTRRGWVVSSTPRPHFTPGKDPVPILQEAGRDPGPVWTGGKSRPHQDSIPHRPARSHSLYWLSYRAHTLVSVK